MVTALMPALEQIGVSVSRETAERLQRYLDLLSAWSERLNLIGRGTQNDLLRRHLLDCAQIALHGDAAGRWVDLGSGGGLPGMVLAIIAQETSQETVLIESNRKKTGFLATCVGTLGLERVRIEARRAEDCAEIIEDAVVVTARALAPLDELLELAAPSLTAGGKALFHKGRGYRDEVAAAQSRWRFDMIEHQSLIDPDSRILDIRNLRPAD